MLHSPSSSSSPSASRRYESLEELLKQAGYKETRIFTPQRPLEPHSHDRSGTKSGSVRDVLKLFSSWVKKDDDGAQPTLRHASSVPHMRGRRPQHQHQHQQSHQQTPVPTWFTSLFSQITTSHRGSRTAPSTPNGKRRARPLPALLSNPRRPTTSHVSVTMSSVVCRPHSSSRPANKCPCHPEKRSDSTSTSASSVSVFEVSLHTVSSRSSSTQAEGSSSSGSSRTSAGSALLGAKPTTLHSRRVRASTGVPLLVSELQCPSRPGCRICSYRDGAHYSLHQRQPENCTAAGRGRGCASANCQHPRKDAMFHLPDESRPRSTYISNDDCHYDGDKYDDYTNYDEYSQRINYTTSMDGDERVTVENTDTDDNEDDDDDDDRIDLARILIPPRRQHSILSLREVLHMDAKRTTETGPGNRLLRANRRTMSNQNLPVNGTPRKKAFLPPRFFEFRDSHDLGQSSTSSTSSPTITPPSSPLQQSHLPRTPQPPRAYNKVESHFQGGSRTGCSQSSLPARMRNVKILADSSLWEEPEGEAADLVQNDQDIQAAVGSSENRDGLRIINLNTSSRRGRGISPLDGRLPNQVAHGKRRGAITSLWNADPIR